MVDSMDQAIGKILTAIDAKGITDNTFVLFFSDNGAIGYGDNGPWRSGKGSVYEGGVRVPAVVRWPAGICGGRNVDAMMGYIDVYPTVKRIAGITDPDPNPLDDRDMLEVIRGKDKAPKRDWFSYIAQGTPDKTAVCDGTWKMVVLGGSVLDVTLDRAIRPGDSKTKPSVELFRLDRDPGEQTNLAAEHREVVAQLLKRLKEFRRLKIDGVAEKSKPCAVARRIVVEIYLCLRPQAPISQQVPRLKLALFGFVLFEPEGGFIFIILCDKNICVHFGFSEIGFVFWDYEIIFFSVIHCYK